MVRYQYQDDLSGVSEKMKSYYQEYYELLKKQNHLFSQSGEFYSLWAYMAWDGEKFSMQFVTGEDFFNSARDLNISLPAGYDPSNVDHVRDVFDKLTYKKAWFTANSLFLVPLQNQEMLNFTAAVSRTKYGNYGFVGTEVYKQAIELAGAATEKIMEGFIPELGWWHSGEGLEKATVRIACMLDTIQYSNKMNDIRYICLGHMWNAIQHGYPADDWVIGAYLSDPAMPKFLQAFDDFTYDKLSFQALKNRDAYEAQFGQIESGLRLSDDFANSFIGMGRNF